MANEIKKKEESNVVAFDSSILLEDVGAGTEGFTKEDVLMPRLSILQQMSPQTNKREGDYVEGAEAGHIFDNVAKKVYDGEKGITVVPISYKRNHIEWKPDRGGKVAEHGASSDCLASCSRGDKGQYITAEGNEIVPTGEYYIYVIDEVGNHFPAMLSMSSSQMKKAKQWNAMISRLMIDINGKKQNPAMFWTAYKLSTVPESNDQGSWFGWSISMLYDAQSGGIIQNLDNGKNIYLEARAFRKDVAEGNVNVAPESVTDDDVM
tara:strand:+ start:21817 stop:22608 length:792 start_codon:yes stop_codon:yes gene_type:complete